ncbi:MAG: ATP-dependent RNA helicase RhlB [Porticoccaceae bacterium]|jgi:ATP-dependent RNA helicase RhlB|nr:ATP-dependent RNA helicase RhlB [Porticoccaceae bacterium]
MNILTSDSPQDSANANKSSNRRRNRSGRNRNNQNKKTASWDISQFQIEPAPGKVRFHDLDLPDPLMHAIADLGFEYCSPIQAQALPHSLSGHDVVGKAQTGTGKTAAFLIAMIDDFLRNPIEEKRYAGEPRALIIAPTRELVMQIAEDAKLLTKYCDLNVQVLVGGMDQHKQRQKLESDLVDILVATPGRLIDFATSNDVHLDQVEVLVIDEADRMLDMGFIPQVRRIVRMTPRNENRQTLFFSATFTDDVERLVERWLHEPIRIEIEPDNMAADSVDQRVYILSSDEKFALLKRVIANENAESLIVFANRRDEVKRLFEKLKREGIAVGILSGEVPQQKRVATLDRFKSGQIKVLVATDVAGRGIHVDNISHVVNYTLPEEPEDYVHRIGRTGRAGKTGVSISFACEDDSFRLEPIEKLLGKKLECKVPPAEHSE